eukprot:COSAG01_NODE_44479_length_418_cov_4.686520_1_plen_81_part_10
MKPALILDERAIRFGSLHVLRETVLARSLLVQNPYRTGRMQLEFTRTGSYEYSCTVHGPTDPYVAQYNTVQLYSRRKLAGI